MSPWLGSPLLPWVTSCLVDGNRFFPYHDIPHTTIIKGDGKMLSIAAASILAKTHRDELMCRLDEEYPQYGWAKNKGYPTIVLVENGFAPLAKPRGKRFDACAQGRLLLLAPWEHHNERRRIKEYQCRNLNAMAAAICTATRQPQQQQP